MAEHLFYKQRDVGSSLHYPPLYMVNVVELVDTLNCEFSNCGFKTRRSPQRKEQEYGKYCKERN